MSFWANLGAGGKAAVVIVSVAALAAIGYAGWTRLERDAAAPTPSEPVEEAAVTPPTETAPAADPPAPPVEDVAETPTETPPPAPATEPETEIVAEPEVAPAPAEPEVAADAAAPETTPSETADVPTEEPVEEDVAALPEPTVAPEETAEPEVAPTPDVVPQRRPSFDVVRVEPDGNAIIAGAAMAGSTVDILIDGEAAASTEADQAGRFVALFSVVASKSPRLMTLRSRSGEIELFSEASVILAPTEVEPDVAEEQGDAAPEVTETDPKDEALTVTDLTDLRADDALIPTETETAPEVLTEADASETPSTDQGPNVPAGAAEPEVAQTPPAVPATTADQAEAEIDSDPGETPVAQLDAPDPFAPDATERAEAETSAAADVSPETTQAAPVAPEDPAETIETALVDSDPGTVPVAQADASEPALPAESAEAEAPANAPAVELEADPPQAPQVLLATDTGIEVLQPGGRPEAGQLALSLDSISYDDEGEVILVGRGSQAGEGFVRVYVDNRPIESAPVGADGTWKLALTGVEAGVYTLRVDEVDSSGGVRARVETPFKRETAAQLAVLQEQIATRSPDIGTDGTPPPPALVTVQPGFTLWGIATERYGSGILYVQVFKANKDQIRDPDLIYPGQIFTLPADVEQNRVE